MLLDVDTESKDDTLTDLSSLEANCYFSYSQLHAHSQCYMTLAPLNCYHRCTRLTKWLHAAKYSIKVHPKSTCDVEWLSYHHLSYAIINCSCWPRALPCHEMHLCYRRLPRQKDCLWRPGSDSKNRVAVFI